MLVAMSRITLLAILLVAAVAPAAAAASAPPTVQSLVERHTSALGGREKIAAIVSYVKHGWYKEGTFSTTTYTAQMRPFYRVIGSPEERLTSIHEGFDGSAWEFYPDPGMVVRTVAQAARTGRHSAFNFIDRLVDYQAQGTTLTYEGERDFHGHRAYVLRARLADGWMEDYFLDSATYMLDGRTQVVPMHAYGTAYTTDDTYGDYRPEGGVMMAHRDAEIDSKTGRVLDEGGVTSVEINPVLPLSMFSPPEWARTPLQTMIDLIYQERDGTDAVLETYRAFGAVLDLHAAATGDAVDFTGYQCLKMGQTATAIALLRKNVADHPDSARAHFGLGRALSAGGDAAGARSEFRRALAIDPTFRRAQSALDALK
jgi:hypothetical protein